MLVWNIALYYKGLMQRKLTSDDSLDAGSGSSS